MEFFGVLQSRYKLPPARLAMRNRELAATRVFCKGAEELIPSKELLS